MRTRLALSALLLAAAPAGAVDRFWNTTFNTWSVGTNWSPNGMPAAGDVAYIQNFNGESSHARIRSNVGTPAFMQISNDALVTISGGGVLGLSGFANVGVNSGLGTLRVQTTIGATPGQLHIADDMKLGVNSGAGTLTVWAGTATIADTLHVGHSTGSGAFTGSGTAEVSGGALNAMNLWIAEHPALLTQPLSGRLVMSGTGVGSFLNARMSYQAYNGDAQAFQSGQSRVHISNHLQMGRESVYNLSGGTLTAGLTTLYDNARINNDGGHFSTGTLTLWTGTLVSMSSVGPERLMRAGPIEIRGGSMDLGDNAVSGAFGDFTQMLALRTGYNGGLWNGNGIRSSAAAAAASTSLKTGLGVSIVGSNPPVIAGQTLTPGDALIRYTLYGDANLDLAVDISDFSVLAANFNRFVDVWSKGDFNYDASVDIADFAMLAGNFNQTLPSDLPRSTVPEPVSAVVGAMGLVLLRRR